MRHWPVGSGPRYWIFVARFNTLSESNKKRVRFSHVRALFDSRNVQQGVTQIIYLGPLPTGRPAPGPRPPGPVTRRLAGAGARANLKGRRHSLSHARPGPGGGVAASGLSWTLGRDSLLASRR